MRQWLKDQEVGLDPHFRYRGKNQTRVEAFSDAAFAIALTLTVLSSAAPDTFDELWISMSDVIPFGLCVVLVMVIWYQHYLYFLKYGLQNKPVVVLNTFLIFLVIFYVYPLKFLFKVLYELYAGLITSDGDRLNVLFNETIKIEDTGALMVLYGLGACLIFFTIALMYYQALRCRDDLELDPYELFSTKTGIYTNLLMASIPLLSVIIAASGIFGFYNFSAAGFTYMLYPPVMITYGKIIEKKRKTVLKNQQME